MPAVPEFILRKLYLPGSLENHANGFSFSLNNTFAPGTLIGFGLDVDRSPIPPEHLTLQIGDTNPKVATQITPGSPTVLPVGEIYTIQVQDSSSGEGRLTVHLDTKEAGPLEFTIQVGESKTQAKDSTSVKHQGLIQRLFPARTLKAEVEINTQSIIGEINPYIYGHFVEHLERCVYGGIWTDDGARLREDTLALINDLHPPVIRYPGGNFASGYHWEDGIGPRVDRPQRFDQAWNAQDSNQVGTDEFLEFCAQVSTAPFLVVNDGSGTPEEAARWVAYCNQKTDAKQGRRRIANGHPQPYNVRLWGVGNEVWGQWQIGHTDACTYASRMETFIKTMRAVDPTIQIVAVGDKILSNDPEDPGRKWNEIVLHQAGDLFYFLSFHIYQPDQEGWQEHYDSEILHHTVCAAPLDVETIIQPIAAQIKSITPERDIRIALDEWNLWLPPPENAKTMHHIVYSMRDAVYVAGMLNVFHRQCSNLSIANLAQLVNVLPAIVTPEKPGEKRFRHPVVLSFLVVPAHAAACFGDQY